MIFVLDNYDSFTYNLVHMLYLLDPEVVVRRNREVAVDEVLAMKPDAIVLSPGPGRPAAAGIMPELIGAAAAQGIPMLGVCLGHQGIGEVFGAKVVPAKSIMHGKLSEVAHDGRGLFDGVANPLTVVRYHSLALDASTIPPDFEISCRTADGEVMGIRHKVLPIEGIQYHPESIKTEDGMTQLANFIRMARAHRGVSANAELPRLLNTLLSGSDLSSREMELMLDRMTSEGASSSRSSALLAALRAKGESRSELVGAARFLRRYVKSVDCGDLPVVDVVGTGGDGGISFNVSTTAAFVAAGAGAVIAKHGNRAVSGKCGAADVLAELGFNLDVPVGQMEKSVRDNGIAFLFAPKFHERMGRVAELRHELGVRTIFNLIGPLANPAGAKSIVLGVCDPKLTRLFAEVLSDLGAERALVVHGDDGLDEISCCTPTMIAELKNGKITEYTVTPEELLGRRYNRSEIAGGDAAENAKLLKAVLSGQERGAARAIVVVNAAATLIAAGLADSFSSGIKLAERSIDSGAAMKKLAALIAASHGM